jgi:hypothetical protein
MNHVVDLYDALGVSGLDAELLVAHHEAGHVWAYHQQGLSIRYVTLRPRGPLLAGRVAVGERPIRGVQSAQIAMAGPTAESIYASLADTGDYVGLPPDDVLDIALNTGCGGPDGDASRISAWMMDPQVLEATRRGMMQDWAAIEDLATQLARSRTLSGRQAFRILDDHVESGARRHRRGA